MHFRSLSYPSGSLAIGSALGLSLFERGMVSPTQSAFKGGRRKLLNV